MSETPQDAPKIEFPCDNYPIKVVGSNKGDLRGFVIEIVQLHVADFDMETVTIQDSRNGRFRSVRFNITATGVDQLKALHEALIASDRVHMVI
ncbi:YbeD family protein [Pontibacter sp. JAM-7]|uniref:YbeD family protein n=1 Tax=Pontibacter sp. JAM-7 TaxID=3366581 RepID=UPI003AF860CD